MIKDRIVFTGDIDGEHSRVELVTRNDDKGTFSSKLCNSPLPGNTVYGYTTTRILLKSFVDFFKNELLRKILKLLQLGICLIICLLSS